MDLAILGYLLFTIPGFCLVWTYRHFTQKTQIGDFEYAMWSFVWGTLMFVLTVYLSDEVGKIVIDVNNPLKSAATSMGIGFGLVVGFSFPAGYLGAVMYSAGLFTWIDSKLFAFIEILKFSMKEDPS